MGGKPIEGVADGVEDTDAVNKGQMDTAIAAEIAAAAQDPVTLAGTPDYLALSGQEITLQQIDLTADVTGVLPVANFTTGTPDGTKFVRDDGVLTAIDTYPWTEAVLAADATVSSTTWIDVHADFSFAVAANTTYIVELQLFALSSTSGLRIGVNGPSSPTTLRAGGNNFSAIGIATAYNTYFFFASSAGTIIYTNGYIYFSNGANAGTLALRISLNSGTTTAGIKAGSMIRYREVV